MRFLFLGIEKKGTYVIFIPLLKIKQLTEMDLRMTILDSLGIANITDTFLVHPWTIIVNFFSSSSLRYLYFRLLIRLLFGKNLQLMFVYFNVFFEKCSYTHTHTQKKKVLKKTDVRCFSLTITYGKIGQRTFKEEQKKTKNIEQEKKNEREYRMYNAYARDKKKRR
jgi:hypothetical protein